MMPSSYRELERPSELAPGEIVRRIPWPALALCVFCSILFFYRLGDRDLSSSHEARAGQDAQSILTSGKWDLPRLFDGRVEMQKPPLYYWLVALFGLINGGEVDAWCVRLPSALSAFGCVLLLYLWGIRRGRPIAGFAAAVMLATCVHFTGLSRIGRIDMPLTLTVSLTLIGFYVGVAQRRREGGNAGWHWYLLAYLAIAAGIMLKGPIAIALPIVVGIGWRLTQRLTESIRPRLPELGLGWGIPTVILLTFPWYFWANYQTGGEFFNVFFWHHNLDRGFGTDETLRAFPFWYYGPQLLLALLPWSLLLPVAVWSIWKNGDRDGRFGAVWCLAIVLLLSCMRFKRTDYLLPAFPGAAWMLGCVAERWYATGNSRRLATAFSALVGVTTAVWLGYVTLVIPAADDVRTHRRFAEEIRHHTSEQVIFFWAEAHLLGFHVGQPLTNFVEWDRLDACVGLPHSIYVVMPRECLRDSPKYLTQGSLELVADCRQFAAPADEWPTWLRMAGKLGFDVHERPYVLVRTCPATTSPTVESNINH